MNQKLFPVILLSFLFFSLTLNTGFNYSADHKWKLVWSDEFNGPSLDPAYWSCDIGRGPNNDGYGSCSLESFTDKPGHVFLSNGNLVILAGQDADSGDYIHSGQVTTKGKRIFQYGKIEARMKLPHGYGMWPGFCMYGTNIDSAGWPECGEIDIMEMRGGDSGDSNRTVMGTIHYRNSSAAKNYPDKWTYEDGKYVLPGTDDFSKDYHIFGIVWDKDKIIFQVDGIDYYTNWIKAWYKSEFRAPCYFYFNFKIGGQFFAYKIKSIDEITAPLPQTMLVDWVRYFE